MFSRAPRTAGIPTERKCHNDLTEFVYSPSAQHQEIMDQHEYQQEMNALMVRRREELDHLKKLGIEPYPHEYERDAFSAGILETFTDEAPKRVVSIAGRIMSLRRMGKASFCHLQDSMGKIQVYLRKDDLGDTYDAFRLLDIGDIIGVKGFVFRTKMGEVSIHAQELKLLTKSLRPLPVVKEKQTSRVTRWCSILLPTRNSDTVRDMSTSW